VYRFFFLCKNIVEEGGVIVFSDEILEKIFSREEVSKIPIGYQSTMIEVIEKILEEMGVKISDAFSES